MRTLLATLTVFTLALAACTPLDPPQPNAPGGSDPAGPPELTGTRWDLTQYGDPAAPMTPVPDSQPTLSFPEAGRLGHTTGCNGLGGEYTLAGSTLTLSNVMQTLMACEEPLMTQEGAISQALQSATTLTQTDDTLVIAYAGGELRYTRQPEPTPASLVGPTWQLDGLIVGEAAQSTVSGSTVTLTFSDDAIHGNGGCNTYTADRSGDDTALTIGAIAATKMACVDAGVSDQEALYFKLLQATSTYAIEGDRLTLSGSEGSLTFVVAP